MSMSISPQQRIVDWTGVKRRELAQPCRPAILCCTNKFRPSKQRMNYRFPEENNLHRKLRLRRLGRRMQQHGSVVLVVDLCFIIITSATTVACCILMQILCVVSQKSFSFWASSSPTPSTGVPPLDPAGGLPSLRPPVFFYVPPIILWNRRPWNDLIRTAGRGIMIDEFWD